MVTIEKLLALVGALLLIGAIVWASISDLGRDGHHANSVSGLDQEFAVELTSLTTDKPFEWRKPTPQGGANWIFDIFTPPVIYYDPETKTFTVTPPFPNAVASIDAYEIELIRIVLRPYRFQLVSYAGAAGNYLLTLEDLENGKDVFCAPGDRLVELGIRISDFQEKRVVAEAVGEGATEAFDLVGEVIVEDLKSGNTYRLKHNDVTFLDESDAEFRTSSGQLITLSKGDSWSSDDATYFVSSIRLDEGLVEVEKMLTDAGDKEVRLLDPVSQLNPLNQSNRNSRLSDSAPGTF